MVVFPIQHYLQPSTWGADWSEETKINQKNVLYNRVYIPHLERGHKLANSEYISIDSVLTTVPKMVEIPVWHILQPSTCVVYGS
jgi:hypothetical protein